jgi:hypothetical protein
LDESDLPEAHWRQLESFHRVEEKKRKWGANEAPRRHSGLDPESSAPLRHFGLDPESSAPLRHSGLDPESSQTGKFLDSGSSPE